MLRSTLIARFHETGECLADCLLIFALDIVAVIAEYADEPRFVRWVGNAVSGVASAIDGMAVTDQDTVFWTYNNNRSSTWCCETWQTEPRRVIMRRLGMLTAGADNTVWGYEDGTVYHFRPDGNCVHRWGYTG